MAYDGSLVFDTKINKEGFEKGVSSLGKIGGKAFGAVAKSVAVVTTAITAVGVASTKVGMDFESGMSGVAATMGITVDEIAKGSKSFEMLKQSAKDAGATTKYSATEASEALNYLALAGYDAEKSVKALATVLNLAAAGGLDLAYASDLVTDSMSALGMETDELDGFVDELAKTSQKSNTNIGQLGEAILNIGGTAKIMAGGTVELNTQLGILADNGIKGSEGGTALRNVLLSLSAPTDKQAAAMKSLGIETYDANGNFRSTDEIFQELNGTLGEMSEKERTEVLSQLFNKVDLKSANALLAGSGERFAELSNDIANADGSAQEMADTLNNNLKGKIGLLSSALEGVGITIYESMDVPLMGVVETITDYVGQISGVLTAHEDIEQSAESLGMTAEELGFNLSEIPNGLDGAVEIIGDILADMISKVAEHAPKFMEMAVNLIKSFIEGIRKNQSDLVRSAIEITTLLLDAFFELLPEILILGMDLIIEFTKGMMKELPNIIKSAQEMTKTLVDTFIDNLPLILEMGMELNLAFVDGIIESLPELMKAAIVVIGTILDTILDNLPLILEMGIELILVLIEGLIEALPDIIGAIPQIISAIVDTLLAHDWLDTGWTLLVMIVKGILSALNEIDKAAAEIIATIVNGISDGIDSIIQAGVDIVHGLWQGILSAKDWMVGKVKGFASDIAGGFKNFFGIRSPSTLMAKYGKNIVEGLELGIKDNKTKAEQAMYDMSKSIVAEFDRLGDALVTALRRRYQEQERVELDGLQKSVKNVRQATDDKLKEFDREYNAKLKLLNIETSAEVQAVQDQIDAINDKTKGEEKEIREQEYNKRLAIKKKQIMEEKNAERLLELQDELAEMIATRERVLLLEQRDMQIEALRQEMENIRFQGEEKRIALEEEYNLKRANEVAKLETIIEHLEAEMEATKEHYAVLLDEESLQAEARLLILEENNDEMVDLLESYYPEWYNAGRSFGEELLKGLSSMKDAIRSEIDSIMSLMSDRDMVGARENNNFDPNQSIIQAKKDWQDAKDRGDKAGMEKAKKYAEDMRNLGGTIGADMTLEEALNMSRSVQNEMGSVGRSMINGSAGVVNNNKGITQNVTIVSPKNTPSENARLLKNAGREMAFEY